MLEILQLRHGLFYRHCLLRANRPSCLLDSSVSIEVIHDLSRKLDHAVDLGSRILLVSLYKISILTQLDTLILSFDSFPILDVVIDMLRKNLLCIEETENLIFCCKFFRTTCDQKFISKTFNLTERIACSILHDFLNILTSCDLRRLFDFFFNHLSYSCADCLCNLFLDVMRHWLEWPLSSRARFPIVSFRLIEVWTASV